MGTSAENGVESDELTLREVFNILWEGRWAIVGVTLVLAVCAGAAAIFFPKRYEATVLLSPVASDMASGAMGALGGIASQLGGLGSLVGLSGAGDSKKEESIAFLQSRLLTESYITERNLLPQLFPRKWDSEKGAWKVDADDVPTPWDGNELFRKKIRSVSENKLTGLVTLSITWRDPDVAAEWANDLVERANATLRQRALTESERNIAYLNEQAQQTNVVEIRNTVFALLEREYKKTMLARGDEQYALRVIDPAVRARKPAFPKPLMWIVAASLFGVVSSALLLIGRSLFLPQRR